MLVCKAVGRARGQQGQVLTTAAVQESRRGGWGAQRHRAVEPSPEKIMCQIRPLPSRSSGLTVTAFLREKGRWGEDGAGVAAGTGLEVGRAMAHGWDLRWSHYRGGKLTLHPPKALPSSQRVVLRFRGDNTWESMP